MSEEEPPVPKAKKRKRGGSSASEITVRDFQQGTRIFGRYTLVSILGRGGMGIVWLAHDEELERHVALKFLSEQIIHDRTLVADLKRETKRSLELTHPNIVRIHDFVQDARTACICMEYVNGQTLSDVRANKANNVFEVPDLESLVAQWCGAMHYAHTHARVVHCDLKPTNLMLNVKGVLKITDFGIARSLSDSGSRLTVTRGKSGTLAYMSPQQLNGDPPSVFDDIYSMGATLYELLTGKPPFYRGQIDRQIFDKAPPSIAARRTELGITSLYIVPLQWEDAIAACLAKETIDRPQGALALLERLNLVSPLRVERPNTPPKVETPHDSPPTPGAFRLMEHDTAVESPDTPPAQRGFPLESHRPVDSKHEPHVAKESALTPAPSILKTSNLGRFRRIVAVACLGIASIVALWDVVSSLSRPSIKTRTNTIATTFEASSMSPSTASKASQPKSSVPLARAPSATPMVPAKSVSPIPTAEQIPEPLRVPVQAPSPVPKDETMKSRSDLHTMEHEIISVHEKTPASERLERMTSNGRVLVLRAIAAFYEGDTSTAEKLALEAEQAEPSQPLILNLRGVILVSKGSFEEAEALFGRAATIDQSFREVEYNFASVAFKKRDFPRSRKRFEHLSNSITPRPDNAFAQLLRYRIYLALLLEGSIDAAQHLMQQMQFNADTPAPYYAHAAWEFRRGDSGNAQQWLTSARNTYSPALNLVFADALSDVGWLDVEGNVKSSSLPSAIVSASPTEAVKLPALALTETTLFQNADPKADIHLSLRIAVTPKPNTPNGHTIDVHVSYFDLTRDNKVVPTNARTTYQWMTPTRNWSEPTPKYLLATYVRPKMPSQSPDTRKYGGYIVRLYFDGQLQDEKASSVTLLKAFPIDNEPVGPVKSSSPIPAPIPSVSASPVPLGPSTTTEVWTAPTPEPEASADPVSEIKALENKWAISITKRDTSVIGPLLADDHVAVTPSGRRLDKSGVINRTKNDTDKYELVVIENMDVRVESAAKAIATGLLRERGKAKSGRSFERAYLFTDTWVKLDGRWVCTQSRTERAMTK